MLNRLHEILEELLQKWDCKLIEFNGEDDHVHQFIQRCPIGSVVGLLAEEAKIVKIIIMESHYGIKGIK